MCEKQALREQCKKRRAELKSAERDGLIAKNALAAFGRKRSFFVYLSIGSEAGTAELIEELAAPF